MTPHSSGKRRLKNMWPILSPLYQTSPPWILPNVICFELKLSIIPNPMIEEPILPLNARLTRLKGFKRSNLTSHADIKRKGEKPV